MTTSLQANNLCMLQGLHPHPEWAHCDERGVGPEDEDPEVQLPRHRHMEPLGPAGQGQHGGSEEKKFDPDPAP